MTLATRQRPGVWTTKGLAPTKVPPLSAVGQLAEVLDSPEVSALVRDLEATRWTGRPGYPIRSMVGMALAKSIYAVPTWTRLVALVAEHASLRVAIAGPTPVPSVYASYRFTAKLRAYSDMLDGCIARVTDSLQTQLPEYGRNVAIDASDMPAYANGQRFVSKNGPERERYSDADASWGHRPAVSTRKGGGFYGYRLHASVCTATDLPVAWTVATAREHESTFVATLLDTARARAFHAETCALDKGYDNASRSVRRPTCSAASIAPRPASMASGGSPGQTARAARASGAVPRVNASPRRSGSRLPVCTRWS